MKKVRKKLFTLSGLFMVLAQVFVMAFSGIVAIAVTQDETTKNLFDVNGSSATMAYELVDNDTIKWTVNLKKGANDSPTRFMVDLKAGDSSVVPEQIQSTNPEMVFESNYGDEYIQGGFSEQATGSLSGETTISFVTTRQISNLVVTPKLVTVPVANEAVAMAATPTTDPTDEAEAEVQPTVASEPVNLLENVPTVTFDIPAVEVEETEENQEENTSVAPEVEGDVEDETTTPGTEVETEDGTETPTNTADNGNVATQGVVTETDQDEVEGFVQEPIVSAQYQGFVSLSGAQLLADPLDPFKYYDSSHANGIYPKHETSQYTDADTSDNIRNYNYGDATKTDAAKETPNIELFDVNGDQLNFQDGYHEYGSETDGRINTKKTVAPVLNEENVFQIQLDTIGDAIKTNEKADIVLVLDRSASMREKTGGWWSTTTRWDQLNSAVTTFANDLLSDKGMDVQIGLVGFYSMGSKDDTARADVATFGTSEFTSSSTAVTSHTLVKDTPPDDRGTPTFIGVDAGVNLLHKGAGARNDAQKIMITITDGQPTYRPGSNYNFSTITPTTDSTNHIKYYSTSRISGDGQGDQSSGNVTHITGVYKNYPNTATETKAATSFYSVGFHTGETANNVVKTLGREGAYAASDVASLIIALKKSVVSLVNTIANATITDPLSEYVELVGNVTGTGLYLNGGGITTTDQSFNQAITLNTTGNQITASNVTLGSDSNGRQGYRITYKVKLKGEFHTGKFYPTNGTTYIANGAKGNHYYAVPSIRTAPTPVTVTFNKTNGSEALTGAQFRLKNSQNEYDSNVTGSDGVVTFTNVLPGEYVLSEIQTPDGYITMADMNVIVTRDGKITQEDGETILGTVVNTVKPIDISLNKVGPDGEALTGATFVLRQANSPDVSFTENVTTVGLHELTNVSPGAYELIEIAAPRGYKVLGKIGDVKIDSAGKATFKAVGETKFESIGRTVNGRIKITLPTVINELKPFDLTVSKEDELGEVLVGAEFTLTGPDDYKKVIASSADNPISEFNFTNLAAGTYRLTETSTPEGYVGLASTITIEISELGVVEVSGAEEETVLTTNDQNNTISFSVINKKKVPLPATGGSGTMMFVTIGVLALTATGLYFLKRKDQEVA